MDSKTIAFLKEVLGSDGARAMLRATKRDPRLAHYLVPRTILGWALTKNEYEGTVPGSEVYVHFCKNENAYSGSVLINDGLLVFAPTDEYGLAAHIAAGMGLETGPIEGTDRMLRSLGRSIDALLKANEATKDFEKAAIDLPGTTAKPREPKGPETAVAPKKQGPYTKPKLPKLPVLKVELSNLNKACKTCGSKLFKAEKFAGCICWRDLAKHAHTTIYADGAVVEFDKSADKLQVQALYKELNNG
jgi:hypothetical protein